MTVNSSISREELQESLETRTVEHTHDEEANSMFGFIVFLLSESIIFLSFFAGYIVYKTTTPDWLPPGVEGLEIREPTINTVILVSSSFVIYFAELALKRHNMWGFRLLWLTTMAMGSYFLYGQAVEWSSLHFSVTSGVFGGMFYLLTGFHGLHVFTGVLLQLIMLVRSLIPGNAAIFSPKKKKIGVLLKSLKKNVITLKNNGTTAPANLFVPKLTIG
ncbi:cytochrome c oxidase subunit 3 [Dendronalium phyllosphericum]|uniref:cytochrome c oxidase subunit 3 n=1 Tax=Dendronalium phyllosphericum TaxID=2840445 RepID=UPI001CEC657B|nr:heme-copper oxidase subunit III [Dendronalium phyllosphericum]